MNNSEIPITERSNELTEDIDKASVDEIVRLLKKCDLEIFNGWGNYRNQSILSTTFVSKVYEICHICAEYVNVEGAENSCVVISGCGTSGRLAFLLTRTFNKFLKEHNLKQCYKYLISGGDHALVTSFESIEDNWNAGKNALMRATEEFDRVLFIGITCGLSAPFVGAQVEYCLQNLNKFTPYLLGFNPSTQARICAISGTEKVMQDIVIEIEGL